MGEHAKYSDQMRHSGHINWYARVLYLFTNLYIALVKRIHDDVIKWKHFSCYWPFVQGIHRWPVTSPHKGQWRGALMFSLICAYVNGWVNNHEDGDLRRHRADCDAIVMVWKKGHNVSWNHAYLYINTVECRYNAVQYRKILPEWLRAEYQSDAGFPKHTLTGELWGVFCEHYWENWLRYNGTAMYSNCTFPEVINQTTAIEFLALSFLESLSSRYRVNTLRPRHNGRHFQDDIFECIFLNESVRISIKISLKVVSNGAINNISALVQIMAWRRSGDKPLSEPMMAWFTDAYMRHSASIS